MIFSLYYLCIVDQRPQGENVSHQNEQHQGEYDDIQAALASLMPDANGNVYYFSAGCAI